MWARPRVIMAFHLIVGMDGWMGYCRVKYSSLCSAIESFARIYTTHLSLTAKCFRYWNFLLTIVWILKCLKSCTSNVSSKKTISWRQGKYKHPIRFTSAHITTKWPRHLTESHLQNIHLNKRPGWLWTNRRLGDLQADVCSVLTAKSLYTGGTAK